MVKDRTEGQLEKEIIWKTRMRGCVYIAAGDCRRLVKVCFQDDRGLAVLIPL